MKTKHFAHEIDRSRPPVISVSGGKDSTATLLKALEEYEKDQLIIIFNDTGWEHPDTYLYLEYLESKIDIKINRIKSKKYKDILDLIQELKRFPHPTYRFCTEFLKQKPLMDWISENNLYHCTNWVGIRKSEGIARRKKYFTVQPDKEYPIRMYYTGFTNELKNVHMRFPVIDYSVIEIFEYIKSKGVEVNNLYKKGHSRVGCYPCLISSQKEFMKLLSDPVGIERIKILIELEDKIGCKFKTIDLKRLIGEGQLYPLHPTEEFK